MAAVVVITRIAFALEFSAALLLWVLGLCPWWIAGAVATSALTVSLLMWGEPLGEVVPASRPSCRSEREPSRYW